MTLTKENKAELISKYGKSEGDTGSTDVQVALLTERINDLTGHLDCCIYHGCDTTFRSPTRR